MSKKQIFLNQHTRHPMTFVSSSLSLLLQSLCNRSYWGIHSIREQVEAHKSLITLFVTFDLDVACIPNTEQFVSKHISPSFSQIIHIKKYFTSFKLYVSIILAHIFSKSSSVSQWFMQRYQRLLNSLLLFNLPKWRGVLWLMCHRQRWCLVERKQKLIPLIIVSHWSVKITCGSLLSMHSKNASNNHPNVYVV